MNTYVYILKVTFKAEDRPDARLYGRFHTDQITAPDIIQAASRVVDTQVTLPHEKAARIELIGITKVTL